MNNNQPVSTEEEAEALHHIDASTIDIRYDSLEEVRLVAKSLRQAREKLAEAERQLKLERLPRPCHAGDCVHLIEETAKRERAEAAVEAIRQTDGKAREVVKELLGITPAKDASERMWFETAQDLMCELDKEKTWGKIQVGLAQAAESRAQALEKERDVLAEWKTHVLKALKSIKEFEIGEWGGDKNGWGYCFELVHHIRREHEAQSALLERARRLTRHTFQFGSQKIDGLWVNFEELNSILAQLPVTPAAPKPCRGCGSQGSGHMDKCPVLFPPAAPKTEGEGAK